MQRKLGPEAASNHERRVREGFYERFLAGEKVLDIGYSGGDPLSLPITEKAIGVDLGYPGYDGRTLPFPDQSQDAVFSSHCLEHIDDYSNALADWFRVLKIGGYLVMAVPHRDLYERKKFLPSAFNTDHRRMYTPAILLAEVEASLPVAAYRIRSLRDIDDGFDYSVPPGLHANGCYEIELVIEKIKLPDYAKQLRPIKAVEDYIAYYATQVALLVDTKQNDDWDMHDWVSGILKNLPLPNFILIKDSLNAKFGKKYPVEILKEELIPMIEISPFDRLFYQKSYKDISHLSLEEIKAHYITHGYFEGRNAIPPAHSIFD